MKKILTSKWFALGVGMVGFVLTILLVYEPAETKSPADPAESETSTNEAPAHVEVEEHSPLKALPIPIVAPPPAEPMLATQVGEPGSLRFNNPDIRELVDELLREKEKLLKWEANLNELQQRLALEKEFIGAITSEVLRAKAAMELSLTNGRTSIKDQEKRQLSDLAGVYTNMPPGSAVAILNGMEVDDIALILNNMGPVQKALILENFATNEVTKATGIATEISEKIRRLVREQEIPTKKR